MLNRHILVTGWTGNTGTKVVERLLVMFPDYRIVGISRTYVEHEHVISEAVDLGNVLEVSKVFNKYNFEIVIHVANIRYSPTILQEAETHSIPHAILIHTTGVHSIYHSYSALYRDIETVIFGRDLKSTSYTVLRPTMIYGNSRDHNMHKLIRVLSSTRVFPVFGSGRSKMQPIHVDDLVDAIICCVNNPSTKGKVYDLSGGSEVTYSEVVSTIASELGRKVLQIRVPIIIAVVISAMARFITGRFPVTVEQIRRLQEDKVYSHTEAGQDLRFYPRTFLDGIREQIKEMRGEGLIS